MGFLHKLWDETLAGPAPDSGLGKLRKYNSFAGSRSPSADPRAPAVDVVPISRSITILRRTNSVSPSNVDVFSPHSGSVPSSPVASISPTSPFSPGAPGPGNGGHLKKLTGRKSIPATLQHQAGEPKSLTASDGHDSYWILSALDRT